LARNEKEARKIAEAMRAMERGDPSAALGACETLLGKRPRDAEVLYIKGLALNGLALTDRALEVLQKSLRLQSRSPAAHALVGQIQVRRGKYNDALTHFDKALKLQPGYVSALTGKAQALQNRDEHDKALALLMPMVEAGEETDKQAHVVADCLHRAGRDAEAIAMIEKHLAAPSTVAEHRGNLGLLLAQIHERAGDYDASFGAAVVAHEAYDMAYDPASDTADFNAIMDVFSPDRLPKLPRATHGLDTPVFIVGMPRTGSTLIERIIDAHPAAHGAGEAQIMHEIISDLPLTTHSSLPYPRCALTMRPVDVEAVGATYVERLCAEARGATRVADKMLSNCLQLGLISLILPHAFVIDCRRDPVNTCLSCFMARLLPGAHPWASFRGRIRGQGRLSISGTATGCMSRL